MTSFITGANLSFSTSVTFAGFRRLVLGFAATAIAGDATGATVSGGVGFAVAGHADVDVVVVVDKQVSPLANRAQ